MLVSPRPNVDIFPAVAGLRPDWFGSVLSLQMGVWNAFAICFANDSIE